MHFEYARTHYYRKETMSTHSIKPDHPHAGKIFWAAVTTQFGMGYEVLLRMNAAIPIKASFFDATNPLNSGEMIGQVLGALFLGFAISNCVMAALVDAIGLRRAHVLSLLAYLTGMVAFVCAVPGAEHRWLLLFGGSLVQGFAWGSIEAVLAPLIVTIYPSGKVFRLNLFYCAFALGMLIAAPTCVMVDTLALGWRVQVCMVAIPLLISLALIAQVTYPATERVTSGVSYGGMFAHTFKSPIFYVFAALIFLSTASEQVPSNWIDLTLSKIVGIQGFWLVAFIYTLHIVARLMTGFLDRQVGMTGILWLGSIFTLIGLYLLSRASGPFAALLAGLIFGLGTGVMWGTTLAAVATHVPKGGTLAIGVCASAGMVSTSALMPIFGRLFDSAKISAAGGAEAFAALIPDTLAHGEVMKTAATSIYQTSIALPALGLLILTCLWAFERRRRKALARVQVS